MKSDQPLVSHFHPHRLILPALPFRLALMRATRSAAAAWGAAPREWVAVAWGLHQAGVAFSASFTQRLLQALAKDRGEMGAARWLGLVRVVGKG
jgi:hypothetical protein